MKGENMLMGLSYIDPKFVEESEKDTLRENKLSHADRQEKNYYMKRTLKRPLLIAAVIALMVFLMGCALAVLRLNDLKIGEETYTQRPLYLEDGTKTAATEKVREIISLQGVAESKNQQAAKEWYDFIQSYDQDRTLFNSSENFTKPAAYDAYWVYSQEMVDKADEICEKYGLKLEGQGALLLTQAQDRLKEILGIDGILKKDAPVQSEYVGGRFYECGNFNLDYRVTLEGKEPVRVAYSYADKAYFSSLYTVIEEPASAQEWNYTTADGTDLLLVKDVDYGYIFCDREDAFLYITLGGKMEEVPDITREEMEQLAEVLDYTLKPRQVENMASLAEELDALYRTPETVDPEEEAARQAEYEAHERHDNFADLIADMRDNEDYFTTYSSANYENFWDTMEYCLVDANGDGEEDLILGRNGNILEIWAMQDGKTAKIHGTFAQGYLCEGYVFEFSVVEDGSHYHSYYNMQTKKSLGEVYYYPSDGIWKFQKGNDRKELTEEEAFAIMNSYVHVELPEMKSVQEFPMQ